MGSGGSKGYCGGASSSCPAANSTITSSSSSSSSSKTSCSRRLFHSSCLGAPCGSRRSTCSSNHHLDACESRNNDIKKGDLECYGKVKLDDPDGIIPPNLQEEEEEESPDEWSHDATPSDANANADAVSSVTASPPRFLSRFSFIPANVSFRLSRASSLGSSARCNRDDSSAFPDNLPGDVRDRGSGTGRSRARAHGDLHSPRMFHDVDGLATRLPVPERRISAREPVDRNVRFSRTLSVGRLRDRVLRRSSLSDHLTFCPPQLEREVSDSILALSPEMSVLDSEINALTSPNSSAHPSVGNGMPGIRDNEVETSRSREARYHDLLEHRSNFLERRRRIRSQVCALQRLGSRFENPPGHERSCILSGQHRTGRCTCRITNRDANLNDETSSRASLSRIVMLAEALFEVLDEIHQQSVVLSSRPSVSSLGSVPAPKEVVESLPVRLHSKSRKYQNEETAQCYICLVEYEEGDSMRVLPCHHEFHMSCVDKWLKEIHRVCPLCRGDICRSDSLPVES